MVGNEKKKNPGVPVSRDFCDERFLRVIDKLNVIEEKVDGLKKEKKQEGRDWRLLVFSIFGSVVTGLVILAAKCVLGI